MNFTSCTKLYRVLACCLALFIAQQSRAQEIHFSQFRNAPLQLSPALAGVFDGDHRFGANYRAQWYDVPVNYRTVNGNWDARLHNNKKNTNFFGGGIVFNYDWAGDSKLSTTYLGLHGSYTHQLSKRHFLGGGVSVGGFQRAFKMDNLRWDDQFTENGKYYNSNAPSGENFDNTSIFYGDFSAGLNYHFRQEEKKKNSRTTLDIGAGLMHINKPKKNFYEDVEVRLARLLNIYGLGTFQLTKRVDLITLFNRKSQGKETENIANLGGRFYLDPRPTQKTALGLGVAYRWNKDGFGVGDAIIPNAELLYKDWLFGVSYDINISDFGKAGTTNGTNNLGGPEFSVIYILKKVSDEEFCPTCPLYQ
jgi:type IX secretion system PorP/SprF family membrane protein